MADPQSTPVPAVLQDITGKRFGERTILYYVGHFKLPRRQQAQHYWWAECSCGRKQFVSYQTAKSRKTCGLCRKERKAPMPSHHSCLDCKLSLPFTTDNFYRNPKNAYGLGRYCKKCTGDRVRHTHKKRHNRYKYQVLSHYSGGGKPRCLCCGEDIFEFLTLDHKYNDGAEERKRLKRNNIYSYVINNNFPPRYQTLCFNCNLARAFFGKCPHQKDS